MSKALRRHATICPINQCAVELEQCCRLDQRAKLRNPARIHEQRGQSEHEVIERGQIRCALPGSITDQKLMFEQKRLCGDGACAARAEQLCAGDQQVDGQDDEIAHRANGTIATSGRNAQRERIASHYEFAPRSRPTQACTAQANSLILRIRNPHGDFRYLIHDRDRIFACSLDESIRNLGMIVPFAWFPKIRH